MPSVSAGSGAASQRRPVVRRIHSTDDDIRGDIADQLVAIIWDIHLRLAQLHPWLVSDVCREHGIDLDLRKAS